jgi:hypothetical protein
VAVRSAAGKHAVGITIDQRQRQPGVVLRFAAGSRRTSNAVMATRSTAATTKCNVIGRQPFLQIGGSRNDWSRLNGMKKFDIEGIYDCARFGESPIRHTASVVLGGLISFLTFPSATGIALHLSSGHVALADRPAQGDRVRMIGGCRVAVCGDSTQAAYWRLRHPRCVRNNAISGLTPVGSATTQNRQERSTARSTTPR